VLADGTRYRADRVVLTCDAWANELLDPLGAGLPLTVTQEQFTYFAPQRPEDFAPDRFPVWIWMDDPSFYGFPCYGEPTVKAAQDCGGPAVTARGRGYEPDPDRLDLLARFLDTLLPGAGPVVRTRTCLYTLTPDRDLVLGTVPGHDSVLVGLGAGHGFKFAPTIGRILADLATGVTSTVDLTPYGPDRPALTAPTGSVSWLV
jgi:sarcosine oxidase